MTRKTGYGGKLAGVIFAVVLALGLTACGGKDESGVSEQDFVGVWDIETMGGADDIADQDDLALLKEMGYSICITLWADGKARFDYVDEAMEGTWKYAGDNKATMTLEGSSGDITIEDGVLVLKQSEITMTFLKISDTPGDVAASNSEEVVEEATEEASDDAADETVPTGDVVNAVVGEPFGNEYVTITITSVEEDILGDVGYEMEIENKWTGPVILDWVDDTFIVNGKLLDPCIFQTVEVGETVETFLYFHGEDVGGLAELVNVEGTLRVVDYDAREVLATLEISFPNP